MTSMTINTRLNVDNINDDVEFLEYFRISYETL